MNSLFSDFFSVYLLQFFENFARISDNLLEIICALKGAYFTKQPLIAASEILTYSEIFNLLYMSFDMYDIYVIWEWPITV